MVFLDSLVTWLVLIVVVTFILFSTFSYILGWLYPREEIIIEIPDDNNHQRKIITKRLIWLFAMVAVVTIMAVTGYNSIIHAT